MGISCDDPISLQIRFNSSLERPKTLKDLQDYVLKYFTTKSYLKPDNRKLKGKWRLPSVEETLFYYGDHKHNLFGCKTNELTSKEERHLTSTYLEHMTKQEVFYAETEW